MVESIAVEFIAMTKENFLLVNTITGTVGLLSGMLSGELKYNREALKRRCRKFQEALDQLVG